MNDRILGTIAMICAPALLIEVLLMRGQENALISGIVGMVFMAGWICSNTGMRRMQAAGTSKWGRAVLLIQLAGLIMAFMSDFFEATGLLANSIIFNITDRAWPLSLLWMLVVGITVLVAKRLRGWQRFVPLLCGLALPPGVIADIAFGDHPGFVFCGLAALFWCLLGYVVRGGSQQVGLAPEPAVR